MRNVEQNILAYFIQNSQILIKTIESLLIRILNIIEAFLDTI